MLIVLNAKRDYLDIGIYNERGVSLRRMNVKIQKTNRSHR